MNPQATDGDLESDDGFLQRVAATPSTNGVEGLVRAALSAHGQTRIGGYEVRGRIGVGGMGLVFAARDPRLERDVALKLLRPGRSGTHARLLREARALARLAHPNVVAIHEVGTHVGSVFVAMEYVRGQTLREWMRTSPSLREVADAFAQAARGLRAAHREQIVHRDFKPDNAIIGDDGRVRVLDFGVASTAGVEPPPTEEGATAASVGDDTTAGHVRGTIQYMPPEQRAGHRVGPPADVHAFCVSLYEVLHGHRPAEVSPPHGSQRVPVLQPPSRRRRPPQSSPTTVCSYVRRTAMTHARAPSSSPRSPKPAALPTMRPGVHIVAPARGRSRAPPAPSPMARWAARSRLATSRWRPSATYASPRAVLAA